MSMQSRLELDDLVNQAEAQFNQGDVDGASQLLLQVVEADPSHTRALNDLGTVCYSRGSMDCAEQFFRRALDLDPTSLTCRTNLVMLLLDRGALAPARELLKLGAILHPAAGALIELEQELLAREQHAPQPTVLAAPCVVPVKEAVLTQLPVPGAAQRDAIFQDAFQKFLQNPETCAHPESPVLKDLIYGWGNEEWGASAEYLAECIRNALVVNGPTLECGSGLTTLLAGAVAGQRGHRHWALEHMPEWAAKAQRWLKPYNLTSVMLCAKSLKNYGAFCWYDAPLDAMPETFALVICDGPPGNTLGGRYGLVPIMKSRFTPGCVLLLDDAHREQERNIATSWEKELAGSLELCGPAARPYLKLIMARLTRQHAA